jgi:hypothetical protein
VTDAASLLDLAGLAVIAVTIASMARAARRARRAGERIWLLPRHPAGIAECALLLAVSAALGRHWVLMSLGAVLAEALTVLCVRTTQLGRRLRRLREERAEAEQRYAEARAAWEHLVNGDGNA